MNAYTHACLDAKRWGGKPEDYQPIHDFIDSSKSSTADFRHRALLHHSWGVYLCEKVFGTTIKVGRRKIPVRLIAENHIKEDLGFIPTVQDWVSKLSIAVWMINPSNARKQTVLINKQAHDLRKKNSKRTS